MSICTTCEGSGSVDISPATVTRAPWLEADTPCGDCNGTGRPPFEIVLDDIVATRLVSANRRIHHFVRAEVCADWRKKAYDAAVAAYGLADEGEAWHQRVRITVTYRFPDRRRHDVGNLYPYVAKPIVDGLVDARVVPDDDDKHVIGPDARRDHNRGPHQIRIRIEDVA